MTDQTWDFSTSKIAWDFRQDRRFASFIVGPVGSGKSVPLLSRVWQHATEQAPSPDGLRRTRFAVIRNTMPEIRSTTAETWRQIYPEEIWGEIVWRSPATHLLKKNDVECEVNFLALDKPKDVKKLLSLELTGAAFNEVREVPRSVVSRTTERVGRYRLAERETTWRGIWGDSNPPDTDHYLYQWHHQETPPGFGFYSQPPGVLEVIPIPGGGAMIRDENFPELDGVKLTSAEVLIWYRGKAQRVECPVEVIQAAERFWIVNPWQENLVALSKVAGGKNPLGAQSYYGQALAGKGVAEIRSYLQGVYTFVMDGRKVVPQYNPEVHGQDVVPVLKDQPLLLGCDIGGGTLQPSGIIFQKHPKGMFLIHEEVVCFDMGVERFGTLLKERLAQRFPEHVAKGAFGLPGQTNAGWGDPAGEKRDEIFETASFDYLRTKHGIPLHAAPTQDIKMRIAAIAAPCERMIEGKPGLMLNKQRCPMLHKGLSGAWHFKRLQVTGEDRYADTPNKNEASHPCDGLGYGLLGAGEFYRLGGRQETSVAQTQIEADGGFDVF